MAMTENREINFFEHVQMNKIPSSEENTKW